MNLSDQVVNLDLAKKLKELHVPQESFFYWINIDDENSYNDTFIWYVGSDILLGYNNDQVIDSINFKYSAFTSSELLEKLPLINGRPIQVLKGADLINGSHFSVGNEYIEYWFLDKNLSNACAKILIFLIENKIMEIK